MKETILCYVRDRISNVAETQVMQLATDIHAIKGFADFCKKDDISPEEHELVKIAELDGENRVVKIVDIVLCNGNNAEKVYKELTANLREDEDLLEV